MKKLLALLLCACMLFSAAALAEEEAAPEIKLGQVALHVHGHGFAVISAVVQGDVIIDASIDEFQFMGNRDDVAAIPLMEGEDAFSQKDADGNVTSVLGSKRANSDLYSLNMQQRGGSTVQIAANYIAIENYVKGKTIAELEAETAEADAAAYVDAVSGATLVDTLNYVKGVIEAAKAAGIQEGVYTVYNRTGETVTEMYLVDNVSGERSVNYAVNGFADGAVMTITTALAGGEDGHGRLTFIYKTESGRTGLFATLSIEVAPITLLAEDAMTGPTQISFTAPAAEQTGKYTVYNKTGEKVTSLTIAHNELGQEVQYAGEGIDADASLDIEYSIPADAEGHNSLIFKFVTESGYEGSFETLSIEEAPITLLAADAMTGPTMISFTVPAQTGKYTVYNKTGEKVTSLTIAHNELGQEVQYAETAIEPDAMLEIEYSIPGNAEGHNSLIFKFVTESGYEGSFETLSIETAPITLLAADAMTGPTMISFFAPAAE